MPKVSSVNLYNETVFNLYNETVATLGTEPVWKMLGEWLSLFSVGDPRTFR